MWNGIRNFIISNEISEEILNVGSNEEVTIKQLAEIIRNNIDGLLVETENSMELAKAVLILIADKQKRVTMGENSFSRFKQKYTTERITDSTLEYYNSIVNN